MIGVIVCGFDGCCCGWVVLLSVALSVMLFSLWVFCWSLFWVGGGLVGFAPFLLALFWVGGFVWVLFVNSIVCLVMTVLFDCRNFFVFLCLFFLVSGFFLWLCFCFFDRGIDSDGKCFLFFVCFDSYGWDYCLALSVFCGLCGVFFWICFCSESLILAQDERWRRA